jgi:hypothetical protein
VWPVDPATSLGDGLAPISHAKKTKKEFLLNLFTAFVAFFILTPKFQSGLSK